MRTRFDLIAWSGAVVLMLLALALVVHSVFFSPAGILVIQDRRAPWIMVDGPVTALLHQWGRADVPVTRFFARFEVADPEPRSAPGPPLLRCCARVRERRAGSGDGPGDGRLEALPGVRGGPAAAPRAEPDPRGGGEPARSRTPVAAARRSWPASRHRPALGRRARRRRLAPHASRHRCAPLPGLLRQRAPLRVPAVEPGCTGPLAAGSRAGLLASPGSSETPSLAGPLCPAPRFWRRPSPGSFSSSRSSAGSISSSASTPTSTSSTSVRCRARGASRSPPTTGRPTSRRSSTWRAAHWTSWLGFSAGAGPMSWR